MNNIILSSHKLGSYTELVVKPNFSAAASSTSTTSLFNWHAPCLLTKHFIMASYDIIYSRSCDWSDFIGSVQRNLNRPDPYSRKKGLPRVDSCALFWERHFILGTQYPSDKIICDTSRKIYILVTLGLAQPFHVNIVYKSAGSRGEAARCWWCNIPSDW